MFRKILLMFGMIGVLLSCNEQKPKEYIPKYDKFTNDLERENLIGKVKRVVHSKKLDLEGSYSDKSNRIMLKEEEYTDFGKLLVGKYYGNTARIQATVVNKYDNYHLLVSTTNSEKESPNNYIQNNKYDKNGNMVECSAVMNNEDSRFIMEYDSLNNLIKTTTYAQNDTMIKNIKYEYSLNKQILKKISYSSESRNEIASIEEFKYDEKGRKVETIYRSFNPEHSSNIKFITKYNPNDRIELIKKFENDIITQETYFDKNYNPTKQIKYVDGIASVTNEFVYQFDEIGNWTEKSSYQSRTSGDGKKVAVSVEFREIEYYK